MPSPFPGMDPYLEGSLWMTTHTQLCAEIARQIAPKLRPRYLALTSERFVFDAPDSVAIATRSAIPDVDIAKTHLTSTSAEQGGVATAPLRMATIIPEAVPHVTVEIRNTADRQLVTAIEVLSPTNKRGEGYEEYLAKRRRILLSTAHLLEIDLLRQGKRVPMQQALPSVPYFVFVHRFEERPFAGIWPLALDQPLPVVPVPLLAGDKDVLLDLQLALTSIYDLLGYDLAVDYNQPPAVPLPPEAEPWVQERLSMFREQR